MGPKMDGGKMNFTASSLHHHEFLCAFYFRGGGGWRDFPSKCGYIVDLEHLDLFWRGPAGGSFWVQIAASSIIPEQIEMGSLLGANFCRAAMAGNGQNHSVYSQILTFGPHPALFAEFRV
jgi:hypothetical protein